MSKKYKKGWKCPECGAVMSPKEKVCMNCQGLPKIEIKPYIWPQPDNDNKLIITYYGCPFPEDFVQKT